MVDRDGLCVPQVLLKWHGLGDEEATWLDEADVRGQFSHFSLVDKAVLTGGAIDRVVAPASWKTYVRGKREVAKY